MSDEARYEARWEQHLIRMEEDVPERELQTKDVRVIEGGDGEAYANLDDLIVAVEEITDFYAARPNGVMFEPSALAILRTLTTSLRELRK